MAQITFTIPDAQAAILTRRHGDIATWLKELVLSEFDNENRRITIEATRQLIRKPAFAKAVADLARADPDFTSKSK